jgi:hypothetical protein
VCGEIYADVATKELVPFWVDLQRTGADSFRWTIHLQPVGSPRRSRQQIWLHDDAASIAWQTTARGTAVVVRGEVSVTESAVE